ncbi:double stranded beta helix fold enzyme [Cenarchaeum symbiosum A]|uniref:Double stranded beta helix fold enzyme n=1 Tax=Cenarchaeum symbiosum (strain A) TaxID=414004 RepID=A0RWT0_CENSY|nr:double stranded beta helix fold enzyme [Cenarchaeum symbiosum A]
MKPLDYTRDGSIKEVTKRWFIGTPSLVDLAGELGISESNIFHVTFPDGAKTTLHTHEGGQLLIVTSGTGSMSIFEKTGGGEAEFAIKETDRIPLKQGSIQYIPAGVLTCTAQQTAPPCPI